MDIENRLAVLHKQIVGQFGSAVDCYYKEGYGAIFVPHGYPLHNNFIIFAFPDIAIRQGL